MSLNKIHTGIITEQKILVENKEPTRDSFSIKARVKPKRKTNVDVKSDIIQSFNATITKKQEKIDKFLETRK